MQGEFGSPIVKSASGNVKPMAGILVGFYVNSTSSGVIQFYDDASTGTTTAISGAITPAAGTYHKYPACFNNGLNMVLNSGTINVTLFIQ